jgi:hypothetical protein
MFRLSPSGVATLVFPGNCVTLGGGIALLLTTISKLERGTMEDIRNNLTRVRVRWERAFGSDSPFVVPLTHLLEDDQRLRALILDTLAQGYIMPEPDRTRETRTHTPLSFRE